MFLGKRIQLANKEFTSKRTPPIIQKINEAAKKARESKNNGKMASFRYVADPSVPRNAKWAVFPDVGARYYGDGRFFDVPYRDIKRYEERRVSHVAICFPSPEKRVTHDWPFLRAARILDRQIWYFADAPLQFTLYVLN